MPFRRNVFIVGAGFSGESGAPVVSNFFDSAMELYKNPSSGLGEAERHIFQQVQQKDQLAVYMRDLRFQRQLGQAFTRAELAW